MLDSEHATISTSEATDSMPFTTESEIHEALIANADDIGYPNVAAIRHAEFQPGGGAVDIALFPSEGLHRVVLIEVNMATVNDASDKVVGQLMKYYSQVLLLSVEGLEAYRNFALNEPNAARGKTRTDPQRVLGDPNDEAWCELKHGRRLRPKEIELFVAFNGGVSPVLRQIITVLHLHHNLRIGAIRVDDNGAVNVLAGAHLTNRMELESEQ
jgi:hypothetical protein